MVNAKKSILIVDDDRSILRSFREILESEGYKVETAETGGEAMQKTKASYFDLALLDIRLPDMKGTELLTTIAEEADLIYPTLPRMVKIIVTGHATLDNAVESLNLGADAYLMKPIETVKLLKVVKEKLGHEKRTRETQEKIEGRERMRPPREGEETALESLMDSALSLLEAEGSS